MSNSNIEAGTQPHNVTAKYKIAEALIRSGVSSDLAFQLGMIRSRECINEVATTESDRLGRIFAQAMCTEYED